MDYQGTIDEAKAQGYMIIDIRRPEECAERPLPQADEEIEMNVLMASPQEFLPEEQPVLLVCRSGRRAKETAEFLADQGFKNIYVYGKTW